MLRVAEDDGDGRGRRLIAAADVATGETLLSLPRDACFVDDEVPPHCNLPHPQAHVHVSCCMYGVHGAAW